MANPSPPAAAPSGPGDVRRAAPPAFAAADGHRIFNSPAAPVTPPAAPHFRPFPASSRVGSSDDEGSGSSAVIQADSETSASRVESQESSNQAHSNGRQVADAEERSDGKSRLSRGLSGGISNGDVSVMLPRAPSDAASSVGQSPQFSFGQPPGQSAGAQAPPQFPGAGAPAFTSPLRPIPSFTTEASPRRSSMFSDIPLAGRTPPPQELGASNNGAVQDQSLYAGVLESEFDATVYEASSSFVLFSSMTMLKDRKKMNTQSLGFGALVSPGRDVMTSPPKLRKEGLRCRSCGAFVNLFCGLVPNSGHWRCSICNKLNSSEGEYKAVTREKIQNWPELVTSVVDYTEGGGSRRQGFVSVSDSTMAAPVVVLIDESLDDPHLQHLQCSMHSFLDSLSPTTRIGIITFGKTVSVFDLSVTGLAAADVLPGDRSPNEEHLKMLIYGTGVYLAPIHVGLAVAQTIISSLRPYRGHLPEAARDRCLGTAVEVALSLIQGPSAELPRSSVRRSGGCNRIIACVGGPNTLGIGSVPYSEKHLNYAYLENKAIKQMDHLGNNARRLDTAVDVLCAGTCPVRIPILQPLAKASGGALILHDDYGETFGLNMQRVVRRASGFRGLLEIRCSREVAVTRVIGPGEVTYLDSSEFQNDTCTAIQMSSVEDGQGFAVSMELEKDITDHYVNFQFVASFTNIYQMQVTRVITVRLPTTGNPATYLQSVNDEVAAVLCAKRTVLMANKASDLADARASVSERVKDITYKFGSQTQKAKMKRFPKEIPRLPELLFHFKRGPLLGSVVGHEDERAVYRSLFLQASFELALRMMVPRLLMHRDGGTFEELPAYDLALQSDTSLVMDHGTDLFIWMGLDVAADEGKNASALAACRTLAQELTENRFPSPRVLAFKEASSQARYLNARLVPAHKDPPYEQEARFPQLSSLTLEQRSRLNSSFIYTDDPSFCEWMRSLKLVPPDPF